MYIIQYIYIYIYTRVLPSISIDDDRFVASTFGCIGRSFGLSYRRLVALAEVLDWIRVHVMALLPDEVGPGTAVWGLVAVKLALNQRLGGLEMAFWEP